MTSNQLWISLFLVGSTALTVGCGDEIICEGGANCATGGGGSGASGGSNSGGNGGSNTGGSNTGGSNTGGANVGGSGTGGGSVDLSNVCDELCECDPSACGGSLQECYASVDEYTEQALAAGCYEELVVLDACVDQLICLEGAVEPPPCLDSASAAVDQCIYGSPPPPMTVCDQASIICGGQPEPFECVGAAQCAALCIVQLDSCDSDDPALQMCLQGC